MCQMPLQISFSSWLSSKVVESTLVSLKILTKVPLYVDADLHVHMGHHLARTYGAKYRCSQTRWILGWLPYRALESLTQIAAQNAGPHEISIDGMGCGGAAQNPSEQDRKCAKSSLIETHMGARDGSQESRVLPPPLGPPPGSCACAMHSVASD